MSLHIDVAAGSRVLPWQMRADLELVLLQTPRGVRSTVKDAVAQRYWRLSEEETFLLQSLDGRASAAELCKRFGRQFAPRRLTPQRLTAYLARLHEQGLIVIHRPGQTEPIIHRQRQQRRLAPLRVLHHLLAWRFRGIDPDRWLARIAPHLRWVFTTSTAIIFAAMLLTATGLVLSHWSDLEQELRALEASFTAEQGFWILATIGLVKTLHELGHAAACKHFGGECHELGIMLFVGVPSLYCNVSDAWMLPGKSPRILISTAGMLVELAIAAMATWLWWWSYPGLVHSLALYAMVLCSVNTLLLNGNPLLQYDGYYALADLTDTPNLRTEARAAMLRLLVQLTLSTGPAFENISRRRESGLVLYGVASELYRLVVVLGIAWFLQGLLEPYGVEFLGWLVGGLLLASLVIEPAVGLIRAVRRPGWERGIRWRIIGCRAGLISVVCLSLMLVPLPASVVAPAVLEPRDMRSVYVEVEGRLVWAIASGSRVATGDVLARLESLPLTTELEKLSGEYDVLRLRLQILRRRQADPEAAAQLPTAEKSLADVEERLRQRRRDFARLVIRAPRSGVVFPPMPRIQDSQPAPTWVGTPLEIQNLGCELRIGDVICVVGEPNVMDALVYVPQGDDKLIRDGQPVEMFVDSFPFLGMTGTVSVSPTSRVVEAPPELVRRGELPMEQDHGGQARPKQTLFTARIELAPQELPLLIGGTGRAKVTVAPRSLAARLWRSLGQTLRAF